VLLYRRVHSQSLQQEFPRSLELGSLTRVQELLETGASVNLPGNDPDGETPLIRAINSGQLTLVRLLLKAGADVNLAQTSTKSWTPLMYACAHPQILQELLAAGGNANARSGTYELASPFGGQKLLGGETALHLATKANQLEAVNLLLQAGADVEARDATGAAPLDVALRFGTATEVAEALVQTGAKLTPERLEVMHSGAHDPEVDLANLSLITGQLLGGKRAAQSPEPVPPDLAPGEIKCPKCGALFYSRKSKICGNCGVNLPYPLSLTDSQARSLEREREWARNLAGAFDPRGHPSRPHEPPANGTSTTEGYPEAVLQRLSCAQEFRHRKRPLFWMHALVLAIFVGAMIILSPPSVSALVAIFAIAAFAAYRFWRVGAPYCPNCRRNIQTCLADYCHVCGEPLSAGRCSACAVDHSWSSWFAPYSNLGNFKTIAWCPGCGVQLDSPLRRWRVRQ